MAISRGARRRVAEQIEHILNNMPSSQANEAKVRAQFQKDQAAGELTVVRLWEEPLPGCGGYFDAVLDHIDDDVAWLMGDDGEERDCHVNEVELVDPPTPVRAS